MDRENPDIFSPINNFDDGRYKRRTDSFSKFLKGPDAFKKIPTQTEENVNEETLNSNFSSDESSKTLQDKSTKNSKALSLSMKDDAFVIAPGSESFLKNAHKSAPFTTCSSTKGDFSTTTAKYKMKTTLQSEAKCISKRKQASNKNSLQFYSVESSVPSAAAAVSAASKIKEIKNADQLSSLSEQLSKVHLAASSVQSDTAGVFETSIPKESKQTKCPSSLNQPQRALTSSEIHSRIEKMVSDALKSQQDSLYQLTSTYHFNLLKVMHETKEELEQRRAVQRETLCKAMEGILEENSQLRNAVLETM